jgi:arabinofuranan 3-O-arabinosyltransferase
LWLLENRTRYHQPEAQHPYLKPKDGLKPNTPSDLRSSQEILTEGKATWWKLQSIFSMARYFGGAEQLAWALMWRSRVPYTLKAAALAAGTPLATPYLAIYDMMVLAIPVAFLVRIGLKTGFRGYELPALGGAIVLIACHFTVTPTGLAPP